MTILSVCINHWTSALRFTYLAALACCFVATTLQAQGSLPVTFADLQNAQTIVASRVLHTPLVREYALSQLTGAEIYLKLENLQLTNAFKIRGAFNKLARLSATERARGVVTASTGNHAQAVALASREFAIPATIVMPVAAPQVKIAATRAYGGRVVLHGASFDEALAHARQLQRDTGATFIHPFDDPQIIAGQGTIGLEIMQDLPTAEVVLVPVGGGGLASGIAIAVKGIRESVRVIGAEALLAPSLLAAQQQGRPVTVPVGPTLADGAAVARTGKLTFAISKVAIEGPIMVSEEAIQQAVRFLLLQDKVLVEGAGALGVAALLSGQLDLRGKKVVVVLSGGNLDEEKLIDVLTAERPQPPPAHQP